MFRDHIYLWNHRLAIFIGPNAQFELTPVLSIGIFIGVLTALVCIAFGTTLALKFRSSEQLRRRRLHQPNDSQFDKPFSTRPGNLPIKDKISLPLGVGDMDDIYDDKNPDVVPYNEGKFCKHMYRTYPDFYFPSTFFSVSPTRSTLSVRLYIIRLNSFAIQVILIFYFPSGVKFPSKRISG